MRAAPSLVAVVDDDRRILESLQDLLESAGFTVRLFDSAQALLCDGELARIDCMISDIGLPIMDGFELLRRARVLRPDLPVIFISGRHEPADHSRIRALGCSVFFHKPFDGRKLIAAIDRALRDSHGN